MQGVKAQEQSACKKEGVIKFLLQKRLLKLIITNHINNRVQEFTDPITSTLILMSTSPLQIIFCDEGMVLFKTTHLPIFPYSMLEEEDKAFLLELLQGLDETQTQASLIVVVVVKEEGIIIITKKTCII